MKKDWFGYSIPFGMLAIIFVIFPFWEVDDAFIVLRYARNWVESGVPVWNLGEDPVEGYTGFIWMGLATGFLKLGFYPLVWLRGIAILACFGSLLLILRIGQKAGWPAIIIKGAMVFFALSPLVYTHATSGLETSFFSFTLLLGLRLYQWASRKKNHWGPAVAFAGSLLLCGLVRPEGVIAGTVLIAFYLSNRGKKNMRAIWQPILGILMGLVIPGAIYFGLRWSFYGQFFPNTVYAKKYEGVMNLAVWGEAFRFSLHYLSGGIAAVALLVILARKSKKPKQTPFSQPLFLITTLIGVFVLLGYSQTHLYMGYSFRFFAPFLPLALIGLAELGSQWYQRVEWGGNRIQWLLLVVLFLQALLWGRKWKQEINFVHSYQAVMEEELKAAGQFLASELPPQSTIAVYMDVGAISWHTDHHIIDFGRLNDKTLAHLPAESSEVVDYFFDQNPDAAVFTSLHPDTLDYITEAIKIQSDNRFDLYKKIKTFQTSTPFSYYQFVYLRQPAVPDQ